MRFTVPLLALEALLGASAWAVEGKDVQVTPSLPARPANTHYVSNREPLLASPLTKLPIGAIKPEGWMRQQLLLMADGFTGRLEEISPWCAFKDSAWASKTGKGRNGWEELPYWLKGFVDLGYVLHDKRIIAESSKWIDAILASQRKDGYFGPESNRERPDLWPNMLALEALRSHYEATGDARVIPFMLRYCKWLNTLPLERYLPNDWQQWRGGDQLDSVYWLYNRTGEKSLLELARVTHERTADWTGGIPTWHGVNMAQGFREPGQYYVQSHDARYLDAAERNYQAVMGSYGQVPGGLYAADENARPGYTGPRQGAETCTMVEMMWSDELLLAITGDPKYADRCEDVAFNSLPASMTPDLKGLHYLTAPNQIQLDRQDKSPMIQNGGDMFSYNPHDYRCCQHNVAFGWPYYAEHLWMATPKNGLAATLYAPCSVHATVGLGSEVTIKESTDYPFGETVNLAFSAPKPVRFPLALRIPAWCANPTVKVNGGSIALSRPVGGWMVLTHEWRTGDHLELTLPMQVRVETWERNRGTVSVYHGPLGYSLKIGERRRKYGDDPKWANYEVLPTTPWNYGLELSTRIPAASLKVVRTGEKLAAQPFSTDSAPIHIVARGRRIPEWKQESNGMVGEVQPGPVVSDQPSEEITLIPMGCARLRISAFPRIGRGPDARQWGEGSATASASFVNNELSALNDGILPRSSASLDVPRFTWWDHVGTREWVQYTYVRPHRLTMAEVYWFDDEAIGGQCRTPASWRLLYLEGGEWTPVPNPREYGTRTNRMNRVTFTPVETTALRLEVQLKPGFSGGILEWKAGA